MAAAATQLTVSSEGSNSCRVFASHSLEATLKRPPPPPSEGCPAFEDRRGKFVVQLRLGKSCYLYGPHPLRACEHLRPELLRTRHVGPYCQCFAQGHECPEPWNSTLEDWAADILEIQTEWPQEILLPPPAEDSAAAELLFLQQQSTDKKLSKPQRKLAQELSEITPISKFAIFRPAFQEPLPELAYTAKKNRRASHSCFHNELTLLVDHQPCTSGRMDLGGRS